MGETVTQERLHWVRQCKLGGVLLLQKCRTYRGETRQERDTQRRDTAGEGHSRKETRQKRDTEGERRGRKKKSHERGSDKRETV